MFKQIFQYCAGFCGCLGIVCYCAGLTELCGPAPAHPVRRPVKKARANKYRAELGLKGTGSGRFKPARHNAETTLKPILTYITKVSFESRQAKITTDLQYVNCRVFNKGQQPAKLASYST